MVAHVKNFFLLLVALVLVGFFIWPTRYAHYTAGEGPDDPNVKAFDSTRVDRITGDIEVYELTGDWRKAGNVRKALAIQRPDVNPNAVHQPCRHWSL